jgi:hypothetical protein
MTNKGVMQSSLSMIVPAKMCVIARPDPHDCERAEMTKMAVIQSSWFVPSSTKSL